MADLETLSRETATRAKTVSTKTNTKTLANCSKTRPCQVTRHLDTKTFETESTTLAKRPNKLQQYVGQPRKK